MVRKFLLHREVEIPWGYYIILISVHLLENHFSHPFDLIPFIVFLGGKGGAHSIPWRFHTTGTNRTDGLRQLCAASLVDAASVHLHPSFCACFHVTSKMLAYTQGTRELYLVLPYPFFQHQQTIPFGLQSSQDPMPCLDLYRQHRWETYCTELDRVL